MKIWFDTEFIEDGKTIDLISIGLVREDGATLYLESRECNLDRASQWVKDNVIVHLTGERWDRAAIASQIKQFAGEKPEFWAYYADYDWVVLCQLYGTMMDLPKGWPMFCRDLKQLTDDVGRRGRIELPKQTDLEHHALSDAQWTRDAWLYVDGLRQHWEAAAAERV